MNTCCNHEDEIPKMSTQWPGAICSPLMDKDAVDTFANHAVSVYQDEKVWQKASHQTIEILNIYKAQAPNITLPEQLQSLFNGLESHRESLFLQSLLWRQSLNAAKYMSQWIEEKNK